MMKYPIKFLANVLQSHSAPIKSSIPHDLLLMKLSYIFRPNADTALEDF